LGRAAATAATQRPRRARGEAPSVNPFAWSFIVAVDAGYWGDYFSYMAFAPLVDVEVGGLRHIAYGIDWRRLPIDAGLEMMTERAYSGETGPPPVALMRPPPLDRRRFGVAVKTALQTLNRPDQLATNPLTGSALAAPISGGPLTTAAVAIRTGSEQLRVTIEAAVVCLGNEPKGDQLRAVLHRTYLRPAPTQEAAAEVLDLPLSTYRRHLAKAVEQLTDLLWTVEIGDVPLSPGGSTHAPAGAWLDGSPPRR
jgi:hypothetical protein